jgi:hypothetical protein
VVVVVVAVAIAVDVAGIVVAVAGIAVVVVVLTVAVAVIAVAVALNAVAVPVEEALQVAAPLLLVVALAVVALVVVPHLEAGRPQLAPLLNVVHSLLLRMFEPSASHVQDMGPLAEGLRYSPITSPQNSIRALYIIMTVRDTLSRKGVPDMSSGCFVSM